MSPGQSNVTITPLADITGDGTTHQLAVSGTALWIQFIAFPTNAGIVRIGDSTTTSSKGATVAAGGGLLLPPIPLPYGAVSSAGQLYAMSTVYYVAQSGDKISVLYGH